MKLPFLNLDIEPTNRCNAKCYFCPRDQTPDQGLLRPEVFDMALRRAVEFRPLSLRALGKDIKISLCGLGEPLLNKHTPDYVAAVRDAGFECAMASNAALLTEPVAARLLEAGLTSIQINAGEHGAEYEDIYKLPWDRTFENIVRFNEMAGDACATQIVLVKHRQIEGHTDEMVAFWRSHGLDDFVGFDLINRGGALFVDHMQYETYVEQAEARELLGRGRTQPVVCQAPFSLPFIGYDGQYYLCCSDWRKEAPLGSVFEASLTDVTERKLRHVTEREPVCKGCNHDPLNRVTEELRLIKAGQATERDLAAVLEDAIESDDVVRDYLSGLGITASEPAPRPIRSLIPVRCE